MKNNHKQWCRLYVAQEQIHCVSWNTSEQEVVQLFSTHERPTRKSSKCHEGVGTYQRCIPGLLNASSGNLYEEPSISEYWVSLRAGHSTSSQVISWSNSSDLVFQNFLLWPPTLLPTSFHLGCPPTSKPKSCFLKTLSIHERNTQKEAEIQAEREAGSVGLAGSRGIGSHQQNGIGLLTLMPPPQNSPITSRSPEDRSSVGDRTYAGNWNCTLPRPLKRA